MTFTRALSTNNYGPAKFIVDGTTVGNGTHSTIASALTSASSGDTIFIRPGTYTENLTLKAGVNISAYNDGFVSSVSSNGNVTIIGKCSFSAAGNVNISGIELKTNSDYCLSVTGSSASAVNLINCYIGMAGNTAIQYTSSSGSSFINIISCICDTSTTGITLYTHSAAGFIRISASYFENSGGSTTKSDNSSGVVLIENSRMIIPVSTSGTGVLQCENSKLYAVANDTMITHNSSDTDHSWANNCFIRSGTSSAVSITAGKFTLNNCVIASSNTNAITGSASLAYAGLSFRSSSNTMNTTTQTANITRTGVLRSDHQPLFIAANTLVSDVTGDGTTYAMIFDSEILDQASNYNNATGVFTAPYTGNYLFTVSAVVGGLTASHTSGSIRLVTTARTITLNGSSYGAIRNASNIATVQGSVIARMTAGDTAYSDLTVSGGTKVADFNANGYFTGSLLC